MDTPQPVPKHDREILRIAKRLYVRSRWWHYINELKTDAGVSILWDNYNKKLGSLEAPWLHGVAKSELVWP